MSIRSLLTGAAIGATISMGAPAQTFVDSFSYPDGTTVPGWTEKRGDWVISNGQLFSTAVAGHAYITFGSLQVTDSVTEVTVTYEGSSAIQMGGLCARETDAANNRNVVMCKVQDNSTTSTPAGFDIVYNYEFGASPRASRTAMNPPQLVSRVRHIVVDNTSTVQVDTDMDGFWDITNTSTLTTELGAGNIGCAGGFVAPLARSSAMDDFAYFDAVLTASGTPRPGGTVTLNLRGFNARRGYQVACSFGNTGIPIDTRRIPLNVDDLMILSTMAPTIFTNFAGSLDGTASATAGINIPNIASLLGVRFYAGFVELDPQAPSGVSAISNDHLITITP